VDEFKYTDDKIVFLAALFPLTFNDRRETSIIGGSWVAQLGAGVVPGYENKQLYLEDEAVPPLKTLDFQYLEGNTQWQRSVLRMQFGILAGISFFGTCFILFDDVASSIINTHLDPNPNLVSRPQFWRSEVLRKDALATDVLFPSNLPRSRI